MIYDLLPKGQTVKGTICACASRSVMSDPLRDAMDCSPPSHPLLQEGEHIGEDNRNNKLSLLSTK